MREVVFEDPTSICPARRKSVLAFVDSTTRLTWSSDGVSFRHDQNATGTSPADHVVSVLNKRLPTATRTTDGPTNSQRSFLLWNPFDTITNRSGFPTVHNVDFHTGGL